MSTFKKIEDYNMIELLGEVEKVFGPTFGRGKRYDETTIQGELIDMISDFLTQYNEAVKLHDKGTNEHFDLVEEEVQPTRNTKRDIEVKMGDMAFTIEEAELVRYTLKQPLNGINGGTFTFKDHHAVRMFEATFMALQKLQE